MINSVKPVANAAPSTSDPSGQDPAAGHPPAAPRPAPLKAEDALRLVIEPTSDGDDYTYKLFDRATGALLIELPRQEAIKMSANPGYSAGQVFDAKA